MYKSKVLYGCFILPLVSLGLGREGGRVSGTMEVWSMEVECQDPGPAGDGGGTAGDTTGIRVAQVGSKPTDPSCMTADCHSEYKGRKYSHGPVVLGRCTDCHTPDEDSTPYEDGDDHLFELVEEDGKLCLQCHESMATDRVVHKPIKRNKCLACHDPHGSDNPAMVVHKVIEDNCFECHEPTMKEKKEIHSPVAVGQCTACHDPHSSPYKFQLVDNPSRVCLKCHDAIRGQLESKPFAHRPVLENCGNCHDPHEGGDRIRLHDRVPELCFGCHKDIDDAVHKSATKHGALDSKHNPRLCLTCHDPHAADFRRQLRDVPMTLCLKCHDKPLVTDEGGMIRNMKAFLAKNMDHHGPVREKDCGACHNPHGSNNHRILRKEFPPEFYAPFKMERYSLCFTCHENSLVKDEKTDSLTGFRNGTKNLHFVHVNRKRKGRTCRACHDVHASNHRKHITHTVPFGPTWSYEIVYKKSKTGGTCMAACHVSRSYDRIKPIDNK